MTLVVRKRRPFLVLALLILVGVATGGGAWWHFASDGLRLDRELARLSAERDALQRATATLERERDALSRRVAVLERARQVETQAYSRVNEQLVELQDQLLVLKEEVAFYQGIVRDDRASTGVRIQRFVVEPEEGQTEFRFRLVLTRGIRSDNVATGAVSLVVDGYQDGKRVRLDLAKLMPFPVGPLEYSFKHFQRLEGRLRLPARFVPKRVMVQVAPSRQGARPLRETYDWPTMES